MYVAVLSQILFPFPLKFMTTEKDHFWLLYPILGYFKI